MAVTGTSVYPLETPGLFYGRNVPLHPIRPTKVPSEGSLWCVFPFVYTPVLAFPPTGPVFTHHPPFDINDLITAGPLGQTTPWPPGQGVTLGNGTQAYWDGTQWLPGVAPLPLATSVTLGTPGVFDGVPATARAPVTKAELDTINGGAAWVGAGQYVVVGGVDYFWDGNAWQVGRSQLPLATAATAGTPGSFGPANHRDPVTKAELDTINGGGAWVGAGQYVTVGGTDYFWDGAAWAVGRSQLPASTSATAGTPGVYNSRTPADLAELQALTASPVSQWTAGQYVVTGDGQEYYWDGAAWQSGRAPAPLATTVTAGTPGSYGPPGSRAPISKAELDTINGGAAWTAGQYIEYTDTGNRVREYYWDGASWLVGRVPSGPALATGADEGAPGTYTPSGSISPTTKAELDTITANPSTAWTTPGAHVFIDDNAKTEYHWNGTAWVAGRVAGIAQADKDVGNIVFPYSAAAITGTSTDDLPDVISVYRDVNDWTQGFTLGWMQLLNPAKAVQIRVRVTNSSGSTVKMNVTAAYAQHASQNPPTMTSGFSSQANAWVAGDVLEMTFYYIDGTVASVQGVIV